MWAQLITTRLKPGREDDLPGLVEQLRAVEQPGSGLLRSTAMQDQNDPSRVYMLVVFESEEAGSRARERSATPGGTAGREGNDGGDLRRRSGVRRPDRRGRSDAVGEARLTTAGWSDFGRCTVRTCWIPSGLLCNQAHPSSAARQPSRPPRSRRYGSPWSDTRNKPTRRQLRRFQHRLFVAGDAAPVWIVEAKATGALATGGQLWVR